MYVNLNSNGGVEGHVGIYWAEPKVKIGAGSRVIDARIGPVRFLRCDLTGPFVCLTCVLNYTILVSPTSSTQTAPNQRDARGHLAMVYLEARRNVKYTALTLKRIP